MVVLSPETKFWLVVVLSAFCLLCAFLFCVLCIYFCRKQHSNWTDTTMLPADKFDDTACSNGAFDEFDDEFSPRKIEERRHARQLALQSIDPSGNLSLSRIDPEVGRALAVETLLSGTCLFDARSMQRPRSGNDVQIIAAKRDYL